MDKPNLNLQRMKNVTDPYFEKVNLLYGLDQLCQDINLNKNSVVLEVGCNDGVSTSLFAYYASKVICIDVYFSDSLKNEIIPLYNNITFIHGNSVDKIQTMNDNFFDMIYIDADHSYDAVKKDISLSIPKLKSDGYMCGHDYDIHSKNDVYRAVNEIFGMPDKVYEDQSWVVNLQNIKNKK